MSGEQCKFKVSSPEGQTAVWDSCTYGKTGSLDNRVGSMPPSKLGSAQATEARRKGADTVI